MWEEGKEGGEDGGSSWNMASGNSLIEKPWEEAWVDVVMAVGEQMASCKEGRHSELTLGTLAQDHLWSWAREEVESLEEVQGSPVGLEAWEKVDALGTG